MLAAPEMRRSARRFVEFSSALRLGRSRRTRRPRVRSASSPCACRRFSAGGCAGWVGRIRSSTKTIRSPHRACLCLVSALPSNNCEVQRGPIAPFPRTDGAIRCAIAAFQGYRFTPCAAGLAFACCGAPGTGGFVSIESNNFPISQPPTNGIVQFAIITWTSRCELAMLVGIDERAGDDRRQRHAAECRAKAPRCRHPRALVITAAVSFGEVGYGRASIRGVAPRLDVRAWRRSCGRNPAGGRRRGRGRARCHSMKIEGAFGKGCPWPAGDKNRQRRSDRRALEHQSPRTGAPAGSPSVFRLRPRGAQIMAAIGDEQCLPVSLPSDFR
jgi:hypothetical protein